VTDQRSHSNSDTSAADRRETQPLLIARVETPNGTACVTRSIYRAADMYPRLGADGGGGETPAPGCRDLFGLGLL